VANSQATIALANIVAATGATPHIYSAGDFTTGEDAPINLTEGGNTDVYVKVIAEDGITTLYYKVTVTRAAAPPTIITVSLPDGTVGTAYSQTLVAIGTAPITWNLASGSLPGGLGLSPSGVISGTPTVTGTFTFTIEATNVTAPNATQILTIIVNAAPTITIPGAPTNVSATAGNGQATVTFNAPASTGGSPITSYTVTIYSGGIAIGTVSGTGSPITITGLSNGVTYTFSVTANNAIGAGPASAVSNAVTPLASVTPPTPPTPINRLVYLPAVPGLTYDRPAGIDHVPSRSDYVFIIIATDFTPQGTLKAAGNPLDNLKVTTGTYRDTNGGVILERIAIDSMRVTIKMVNENLTITITSGTPDGTETVDGAKVWSYDGQLNLYSPTNEKASIYTLTGQLYKKQSLSAGETVTLPLAKGFYIVVFESGIKQKLLVH
jgi:hypothetical protein